MQLKGAERLYGLLHEEQPFHDGSFRSWAKSPSTSHPFHYLDGVSIWLSPTELDADDDFLSGVSSQQAVSDEGESAD